MTTHIDSLDVPMVLFLDRNAPDDVALLGGKGANLVRLRRWGFDVPRACTLTTRAFGTFLEGAGHITLPLEPNAFDGVPLPPEVLPSLRSFVEATGATRFAVRSSAVAEDSANTSFAGQLETFLNVGPEDLPLYVRRCFASCFSERVAAYRCRLGLDGASPMAVIVQEMVEPDFAGVMFTVDPLHGDDMAVEIVEGLADKLVSGVVTPGSYRIARADLAVKVDHEAVPIPPGLLRQVAETGLRIENLYGSPQDVEFAVRGQAIHLLQSRPITFFDRTVRV